MDNHTDRFNKGHFPAKPVLASSLLDFWAPVIFILSILIGQVETLHP